MYLTEAHIFAILLKFSNLNIYIQEFVDKLCRLGIQADWVHLVKDIVGIIFSLQLLQAAEVDTVDVRNGRITRYSNSQLAIAKKKKKGALGVYSRSA